MADKAHRMTDEKLGEMEKRLSAIYSASHEKIQAKMEEFAKGIDGKSSKLLDAINSAKTEKELKAAKDAYVRYFKKDVIGSKEFKRLSASVAFDLFDTNTEASYYINSQTPEIYAFNYNWINEQLSIDISNFSAQEITEKDALEYGMLTNQTISKAKDSKWNEFNIKKSVIIGARLYLGAKSIMKRTAKIVVEKNQNSANMHAAGMATDAETKARLDGMYRAEGFGNDIKKIWKSTLDNRTRDSHKMLDGAIVPLKELFDNGLDRPRDPDGDPSEVCNCRCSLSYDVGQKRGETRSARAGTVTGSYKKSGSFKGTKSIEVPNMTYREFMEWRKTQ